MDARPARRIAEDPPAVTRVPPVIDGTTFGEISINGKTYFSDMTVFWDGRLAFRSKDHVLEMGEFMKVLKAGPSMVVVGAGQEGVLKVASEVAEWAKEKGVTIYAENTPKAVEMFNAFAGSGRKVVGIFHVTC